MIKGRTPSVYGPRDTLTRAQMASLLDRTYELLGGDTARDAPDRFRDDEGNVHEVAIDRLAALGVTSGVTTDAFAPARDVQRDQMASFLSRLLSRTVAEGKVTLTAD